MSEPMSKKLRVVRSRADDVTLVNCALVNPADSSLGDFVKVEKEAARFVFRAEGHPAVGQGHIGFDTYQRRWTTLMLDEDVCVEIYPCEQIPKLSAVVVEIDGCLARNIDELNSDFGMKQSCVQQLNKLPVSLGQLITFKFANKTHVIQVRRLEAFGIGPTGLPMSEDVPMGQVTDVTQVKFENASTDPDESNNGGSETPPSAPINIPQVTSHGVGATLRKVSSAENIAPGMFASGRDPPILDMRKEVDRLKTFADWNVSFIQPSDLARSGFYSLRFEDHVRCAFCHVEIGRWEEGDVVQADHERWSRNCPFLRGCDRSNVPLTGAVGGLGGLDLRKECDRLKTFSRWPVGFISARDLARSGFYYLGQDDVVRCAFCSIQLGEWVEGDVVEEEHASWAPGCPLATSNNVPISQTELGFLAEWQPSFDPFGVRLSPGFASQYMGSGATNIDLNHLGMIHKEVVVHPRYRSLEARLATYRNWPLAIGKKPQQLAEAGFFYTGKSDETKCFACGGGLRDWLNEDDAWVEHARWFPKCSYLLMVQGSNFVHTISTPTDLTSTMEVTTCTSCGQLLQGTNPMDSHGRLCTRWPAETVTSSEEKRNAFLCKICCVEEVGAAFLPCGHVLACVQCAVSLDQCPLCRKTILANVKIFLS